MDIRLTSLCKGGCGTQYPIVLAEEQRPRGDSGASSCYNALMNNYNFTLHLNPDGMFLSIVLRFIVPGLLLSVGIAMFSYMVSKGKKRQGLIALGVSVLVMIGWIAFTVVSQ